MTTIKQVEQALVGSPTHTAVKQTRAEKFAGALGETIAQQAVEEAGRGYAPFDADGRAMFVGPIRAVLGNGVEWPEEKAAISAIKAEMTRRGFDVFDVHMITDEISHYSVLVHNGPQHLRATAEHPPGRAGSMAQVNPGQFS